MGARFLHQHWLSFCIYFGASHLIREKTTISPLFVTLNVTTLVAGNTTVWYSSVKINNESSFFFAPDASL
jgi:hypothetical protein